MPKLVPKPRLTGRGSRGGVPAQEASIEGIARYLNNCVWQSRYIQQAFAADRQPELAKLAGAANDLLVELRDKWRGRA